MFRCTFVVGCVCFLMATVSGRFTAAETILFESGTLGPTGIPYSDLEDETVRGTNVNLAVYTGVRFFLEDPVVTSQVGGHFIRLTDNGAFFGDGTFFGAIVELDDATDFPDSGDFSTPDFLGAAVLEFPEESAEVFGDLELRLDPGWYALAFGSGRFGTSGSGAALRNNPDIGDPEYIAYQNGSGWSTFINPIFRDHRFVITGVIVPEPGTKHLVSVSVLAAVVLFRVYHHRTRLVP